MFRRALPATLALLSGCLTPQMGHDLERAIDRLGPRTPEQPKPVGSPAFTHAVGLPRRIWYADAGAKVFHERRTNTFVAWDPVTRGWLGLPNDEAFARFSAGRARLLPEGAPADVNRALDRLVYLEPEWRGAN